MPRMHLKTISPLVLIAGLTSTLAAAPSSDWRETLRAPDPQFSQMPFWFWNDLLEDDEIRRQMADFREHGVHGFVIHARMGLPAEVAYMKAPWLARVRFTVEEAARTGMRICLYDEGMYPSGSAHGEVVKSDASFAAQGLLATHLDVTGPTQASPPAAAAGQVLSASIGRLVDDRRIDPASLRVIEPGKPCEVGEGRWRLMTFALAPSGGKIRGVHPGEEATEPGAPAAADLLNPAAMQAFIRLAYEPYAREVGTHFAKTVIGMFTDEPSMLGRGGARGMKPWTAGFEVWHKARTGRDLLPRLPGLFFDCGPLSGEVRAEHAEALAARLDETYYRPLSEWCAKHGIALTGHPAGATEIQPLRWFQIPGQDIVWRAIVPEGPAALTGPNSPIARCSSSVAVHDRRRLNSNELYGAYGWQLTIEEMKWLSDWLMVRGVNLLYPHAFYYSMRGERGQERPPDVGPNNAWWPHYRLFADYTARVCRLLTDAEQVCDVAVLCSNHNLPDRAAKVLQTRQVDFNYLEDWRLLEQAEGRDGRLHVGPMGYRFLILDQDSPPGDALGEKVRAAAATGVQVIQWSGELPPTVFETATVNCNPPAPDLRVRHIRKGGREFLLFVNEGPSAISTGVGTAAKGSAEWFDPWTGEFQVANGANGQGGVRLFPLTLDRRESRVLCFDPQGEAMPAADTVRREAAVVDLAGPWDAANPKGGQLPLGDWLKMPGLDGYAGTVVYRTTFKLSPTAGSTYSLELGAVGDIAVVKLNGKSCGVRMWAPYQLPVTEQLREGDNQLELEVTNSLAARFDPKNARPSGLIGPVRLREFR